MRGGRQCEGIHGQAGTDRYRDGGGPCERRRQLIISKGDSIPAGSLIIRVAVRHLVLYHLAVVKLGDGRQVVVAAAVIAATLLAAAGACRLPCRWRACVPCCLRLLPCGSIAALLLLACCRAAALSLLIALGQPQCSQLVGCLAGAATAAVKLGRPAAAGAQRCMDRARVGRRLQPASRQCHSCGPATGHSPSQAGSSCSG